MTTQPCPLCDCHTSSPYYYDKFRHYRQCQQCTLVFVESRFYLNNEDEKKEYDKHQNNPNDIGYRRFLNRLAEPLNLRLNPASDGLDFGCGPGPTLSTMLEERGHHVSLYDIYYQPNTATLKQQYDFITATEVIEHLSDPKQVLNQLWSMLRPGGMLGIMTKQVIDKERFAQWHYKNDPTHIVFFNLTAFKHFFQHKQATISVVANDILIITKS